MKVEAQKVADWLIWFANEHGDGISNLRLQKLMYYAQAWHLALHDEPLFDADFQAWIHGPVVSWLYGNYKAYRWGNLPCVPSEALSEEGVLPEPEIPGDVRDHLMDVMDAYGNLTAWELERLTHSEAPWIEARGGIAMDVPCKTVIPNARMQQFYKELARDKPDSEAK